MGTSIVTVNELRIEGEVSASLCHHIQVIPSGDELNIEDHGSTLGRDDFDAAHGHAPNH